MEEEVTECWRLIRKEEVIREFHDVQTHRNRHKLFTGNHLKISGNKSPQIQVDLADLG